MNGVLTLPVLTTLLTLRLCSNPYNTCGLNKLSINVVEKLIYFSNSTQIVKLVF